MSGERLAIRVLLCIAVFYGTVVAVKDGDSTAGIVAVIGLSALAMTSKP